MQEICDRCRRPRGRNIISMFTDQRICPECAITERGHPKFHEAEDRQKKEIMAGNFNFPGIGLPLELEVKRGR